MVENNFNLFRDIIGFTALIGGAILILMSKVKTNNLNDLKQRVEILEKEREEARSQHLENQKAISKLEGQLATYKEIPLKSIANSLESISTSNGLILQRLDKDAVLKDLKKDGILVHTDSEDPLDVTVKE